MQLKKTEVWVETKNKTEYAICSKSTLGHLCDIEIKQLYTFTEEELKEYTNNIFEAGRDSVLFEYNSLGQKDFINNLFKPTT